MSLIVQKFGGSSVANPERVRNVAEIITDTYKAGNKVVVVVSAQGDTTDDLIEMAAQINDNPSKREMDVLLSSGEQISMSLLAMAIEKIGCPVVSLTGWQVGIKSTTHYGNAKIKRVDTERLEMELDKNNIIIVGLDDSWTGKWYNAQMIFNAQTDGSTSQKALKTAMEIFEIQASRPAHGGPCNRQDQG